MWLPVSGQLKKSFWGFSLSWSVFPWNVYLNFTYERLFSSHYTLYLKELKIALALEQTEKIRTNFDVFGRYAFSRLYALCGIQLASYDNVISNILCAWKAVALPRVCLRGTDLFGHIGRKALVISVAQHSMEYVQSLSVIRIIQLVKLKEITLFDFSHLSRILIIVIKRIRE